MSETSEIAGKVLDRLTARLENSIENVERLGLINWKNLKEIRGDIRYAKKSIDSFTEAITEHKLAFEDIKFFGNLIAGRVRQPGQQAYPDQKMYCSRNSENERREPISSPWALVKQFDELYNHQEQRIEQRIERKVQADHYSSIKRTSELLGRVGTTNFSSAGDTRMLALDSTSEAIIPSLLGHLNSVRSKNRDLSPQILSTTKEVLRDIISLGKNILDVTETQVEAEGLRLGKLRSEIVRDLFLLQRMQTEVLSKVTNAAEALESINSKKAKICQIELYRRLAELSTKQERQYRSSNALESMHDDIVDDQYQTRKVLSDESLDQFLNRNYENFMTKFAKKMEAVKLKQEMDRNQQRDRSGWLKDKLEHINEIDKNSHILKMTESMIHRREESVQRANEIKQRESVLKLNQNSNRNSTQKLFEEWREKNIKGAFSEVKSKINNGRNTPEQKQPNTLDIKLVRKPSVKQPSSAKPKILESQRQSTATLSKPFTSDIKRIKKQVTKVVTQSSKPVTPIPVKKPKKSVKQFSTERKVIKPRGSVTPVKPLEVLNKILPDGLLQSEIFYPEDKIQEEVVTNNIDHQTSNRRLH